MIALLKTGKAVPILRVESEQYAGSLLGCIISKSFIPVPSTEKR